MYGCKILGIIHRTAVFHCTETPNKQLLLEDLLDIRLAPQWRRCFARKTCRSASLEEWKKVEEKTLELMALLDLEQRTKVRIKYISNTLLEPVALYLLLFSIGALLAAFAISGEDLISVFILCFTFWLGATGALGSMAFIYVNALSIQVDPTVDITSRTLVIMRLILGALFAVILCLPVGYRAFLNFAQNLPKGNLISPADSILLLLPFLMGFSTPLVLAVLGRLIQSARTFFG